MHGAPHGWVDLRGLVHPCLFKLIEYEDVVNEALGQLDRGSRIENPLW